MERDSRACHRNLRRHQRNQPEGPDARHQRPVCREQHDDRHSRFCHRRCSGGRLHPQPAGGGAGDAPGRIRRRRFDRDSAGDRGRHPASGNRRSVRDEAAADSGADRFRLADRRRHAGALRSGRAARRLRPLRGSLAALRQRRRAVRLFLQPRPLGQRNLCHQPAVLHQRARHRQHGRRRRSILDRHGRPHLRRKNHQPQRLRRRSL